MCYSVGDQAGIEIMKLQIGYLVVIMIIIIQCLFWYRVYLGRKNGHEIKYSFWVNLLHPFKFNKPILTKGQKWFFRLSGALTFVLPNAYIGFVAWQTFCF